MPLWTKLQAASWRRARPTRCTWHGGRAVLCDMVRLLPGRVRVRNHAEIQPKRRDVCLCDRFGSGRICVWIRVWPSNGIGRSCVPPAKCVSGFCGCPLSGWKQGACRRSRRRDRVRPAVRHLAAILSCAAAVGMTVAACGDGGSAPPAPCNDSTTSTTEPGLSSDTVVVSVAGTHCGDRPLEVVVIREPS